MKCGLGKKMKKITWFELGGSLSTKEIEDAQNRLEVKFPIDYIELISMHSGGSNPNECEFEFVDQGKKQIGNFGTLLSLRIDQSGNVFETMSDLSIDSQLPQGIIPIIDTGSGDYVCLDYSKSSLPFISYFFHGRNLDEYPIVWIANSFSEFIDKLQEPDDNG